MERRDILKLGLSLGAGAAVTGTTGCAPALPLTKRTGNDEQEAWAWIDSIDKQVARIDEAHFVEQFASAASRQAVDDIARDHLNPSEIRFRDMLKTLIITQSFRELPEEVQRHPLVQSRLARDIDSIDASVRTTADHLESLGEAERESIRTALMENPDLVMDLCETLDVEAGKAGMSANRRMQLRSMMTQTSFRLKSASPSVVIDEQVSKVRRAEATHRNQFLASQMATEAGNESFWRQREQSAHLNAAPEAGPVPEPRRVPGQGAMKSGAWMMGIGAVTFGISAILTSEASFGFVFGMTAGAVLFAIGFFTLIFGALLYLIKKPPQDK